MQYALLENNEVKASNDLPRNASYRCRNPNCTMPNLILKKGPHRIAHFAHRANCDCEKNGEQETDAHLQIKSWLDSFLNDSTVEVECNRFPGVRPDLLWNLKYAIEVQHSSISTEEFVRRNEIYQANGIIPVWIFHAQEPCYKDEDGEIKSTTTLNRGIYGKSTGRVTGTMIEKKYRLLDVEKDIADSQLTVFYFDFNSLLSNKDELDHVKLFIRSYHPYAEMMIDYVDFRSK